MSRPIPTEADWRSEPWCIDTPHAYKHFAGKSTEEALTLFKENALYFQEDVLFMPAACFPFYLEAYIAYLTSEDSKGDSDAASCLFSLVELRAEDVTRYQELVPTVLHTLEHVAEWQSWYEADESIYGSFAKRANIAREKLDGWESNS